MSFNIPHVIAATSVVAALVLLQVCDVSSIDCIHCPTNVECPTLPADCEPTSRFCGCCLECKGKVGAVCSIVGLPCESGLMCVNQRGVALSFFTWPHIGFEGKCQKVDMCQLLTRSEYGLLMRNPEKPIAKVVDEEAGIAD